MRYFLHTILLSCLYIFSFSFALAQKEIPELWGTRVHDEAHILKSETIESLEKELKVYEDSTSNQIAVLIVPSLDGEVLEEYSLHVAEKWKLGQKDKDNGVLLLIAVDDHKMRIEVGQGLEGALTDAQSNRIIRNEIAPSFRRGDFDAGVTDGINSIIKAIGGEYAADDSGSSDSNEIPMPVRIFIGVFLLIVLGVFTVTAVFVQGGIGWGLYAFLIPFYAVFPWIAIGTTAAIVLFIAYVVCMPILKLLLSRSAWGKSLAEKWKSSSRSSGSSGSGWSSWSSGSSSSSSWGSGSSFSGGGGSFGGGGSSGGW